MRYAKAHDENHASDWSTSALNLIDAAPEPSKVLDIFFRRFRPNGWSGSLADALATRAPLINELKNHQRPEVIAWANVHARIFADSISRQRAAETEEARSRDETFE